MNLTILTSVVSAAFAGVVGFGAAWSIQKLTITQLELSHANERISTQRAARSAIERNMSAVSVAQVKAASRAVRLAADNARATSALDSLRTASASALRSAAGDLEACTRSLTSHSVVVGECSARLVEVGKDADDWASHAVMLQDAK